MCIRDENGAFVVTKTNWFSLICDVDVEEAMGLHTALQWVAFLQLNNIDFVLDSKKVVDQFRIGIDDNNDFGCILHVCKQLFYNSFQNSETSKCREGEMASKD
jgi:ribonuclease HI